jgi:hypothetical protein
LIPERTFRIATNVEEEIGPVAGMRAVVVSQALVAGDFFGLAVGASVVENVAIGGRRLEETERVFADGLWISGRIRSHYQYKINQFNWLDTMNEFEWRNFYTFKETIAAVGGPVVIAKVVDGSSAIEEQSILTGFQRERAVGALVKLVAVLRVGVRLESVILRARAQVLIGR